MILIYNNHNIDDKESLLRASFYIACARVFNCIDQFEYCIDNSKKLKSTKLSINFFGENKDQKPPEEQLENNKRDNFHNTFKYNYNSDIPVTLIKEILYNKTLLTEEQISSLCNRANFTSLIHNNIKMYGLDNLKDNIQKATYQYYKKSKDFNILIKIENISKNINDYSLFSSEWSHKILSIFNISHLEFTPTSIYEFYTHDRESIHVLLLLYIYCDKRKQYEEMITHQIQPYISNASDANRPYHLLDIIEAFNNKEIGRAHV